MIGGEAIRVFLFVATLGHSRRLLRPRVPARAPGGWLDGIESAFRHFGGLPAEVLLDNARALVAHHDAQTREVVLQRPAAWPSPATGASGRGPARPTGRGPRARTSAGSATSRATPSPGGASRAGRRSRRISPGGCARWPTGASMARRASRRSCASSATRRRRLRPIDGRPPFRQMRELIRRVQADCAVEVDTNAYSVPWRLIGERVQVTVADGWVRIFHAGREVAAHPEAAGRHQRLVEPATSRACPASGGRPASPDRHLRRCREPSPSSCGRSPSTRRAIGGGW